MNEQPKIILLGNYDHAGTNFFITHMSFEGAEKTACGMVIAKLRGDWQQAEGANKPSCMKCRVAYDRLTKKVCPECDSEVVSDGFCMMGHWVGK